MNIETLLPRSPTTDGPGGIWRWRDILPLPDSIVPVSLGEGNTPLLRSRAHSDLPLFIKDETRNPTGSHKDRPLALAAGDAVATGARVMAVVSAGSTGLSNAAYAARAGLASVAIMEAGAPDSRVAPLAALGSHLVEVDATIDRAIEALTGLRGQDGLYVASTTRSANAVQAEASRTIAYEIVADLGYAPDVLIAPVGGGGTIASIHAGFVQLLAAGRIDRLPRLIAVVPSTYDTLARALEAGITDAAGLFGMPAPLGGDTVLNKIAHDHPPDGVEALAALRESNGRVLAYPDRAAVAAVDRVGREEGLYVEPSSAIAWLALDALIADGTVNPDTRTVMLACGSGFRETEVVIAARPPTRETIALDQLGDLLARIGG